MLPPDNEIKTSLESFDTMASPLVLPLHSTMLTQNEMNPISVQSVDTAIVEKMQNSFSIIRHGSVSSDVVEQTITLIEDKSLLTNRLSRQVTIIESELSDPEFGDDTESSGDSANWIDEHMSIDVIQKTFKESQSQWVDDPVLSQWRQPNHRVHDVLSDVDSLYHSWSSIRVGPFSPLTDKLWLETGRTLREAGLPWHNNEINMPDEIDSSWPFHFKSFETEVIRSKGRRVGDSNPSGYVCNWGEANCYGLRALQQELREKFPDHQPLLVYDRIDAEVVQAAEKLFGLQIQSVDLWDHNMTTVEALYKTTVNGVRPIIFAATLANSNGAYDNMSRICELSLDLPLILHVDASRNFDYITTLTDAERQKLGIEKFSLGIRNLDQPIRLLDGSIIAGSIIAGGANYTSPASVVALKPLALGSVPTRVAYTRASDSTLAGSRDAIAPLWVALQEIRFGESGYRDIYAHCARMRRLLVKFLRQRGLTVDSPPYSVDVIIKNCSALQIRRLSELGGVFTDVGTALLTVQPNVRLDDIECIADVFGTRTPLEDLRHQLSLPPAFEMKYPVPEEVVQHLKKTVQEWKVATRSAAGYPFHMGSYSALGPVIAHFLDMKIPDNWIEARSSEVLTTRMRSFGLFDARDQAKFKGAFTNGSTMGNRVGIHTALTHFPGAYLYFSHETHYSVPKTARDCDALTNRWSERPCRYAEIPCDVNGSMSIDELLNQVITDRNDCQSHGDEYRLVLFLNMGTTFVGARDNLRDIRERLLEIDVEVSYIHMDGALDFGFENCGIVLAPPGVAEVGGIPAVQGVTMSHHKAMGNMVSGEVLCYSPGAQLATLGSGVDPRAIFETWLYLQVYSTSDLVEMFEYCQGNAERLERDLRNIGVITKRNRDSTITVLERPPAWVTEEFSLRPEGDWVHFITMPHISTETIDLFVDRIASVDRQCEIAFSYVAPLLSAILMQSTSLRRVQCRHPLAAEVAVSAQALTQPTWLCHQSVETAIKACLRGAMTIVALDNDGQPQVVFLAESTRDRSILAGPVLVRSRFIGNSKQILDTARQLIGFMARHLHARVQTDEMSYMMLCLA